MLDTRRADYFVQLFDAGAGPKWAPSVLNAGEVLALVRAHGPVVAGNAATRFRQEVGEESLGDTPFEPGPGVPDPVHIALLAERGLDTGGLASDKLSPLYLRAPEAKRPAGGGRLIPNGGGRFGQGI